MNPLRTAIAVFRFALRERDWPLAGLLAGSLGRSVALRPALERELRRSDPAGIPSLGALRTLGALIRLLAGRHGA